LDGLNSEGGVPSGREEGEWRRGREALGGDKSPSEGGLELACHWRRSCHDGLSRERERDGTTESVPMEEVKWLSSSISLSAR